ncbi:DUF58 domain-containing protein [Paracoccus lutimaris]|jgi:uncharacterized protein (DUF58 family)|uniref:Uncharacterized protein DUF58 n=1 Tax=Paracoccus lutimaris TaxID=1490030 RepID=A0A368YRD7_9RHOB|nr:DUF58 domain-containing protein [Paracoccus lutimaris]RCW80704.1 uncharacterized protein DUF58 [Paracoccus lutimaris]
MSVTDPPISLAALGRAVLRMRQTVPAAGLGVHVRRRQGHSLEFREYRPYQRGDDIRTVDWRASSRLPRRSDLLVRSFEAEQQLTLVIVLDNRPDMRLPEAMPKLLYALWAVRALATLALGQGDEVVLARLFSGAAPAIARLRGGSGQIQARHWADAIWQDGDARSADSRAADARSADARASVAAQPDFADLAGVVRRLRPAGAVVVISDMLFDDPEHRFMQFARAAQRQRRSLSVLQLDSLQHETALLRREREFRLIRPGHAIDAGTQQFDESVLAAAADAVAGHLAMSRHAIHAGGLDWPLEPVTWPEPDLPGAEMLKSYFSRTFPRLSMLAGLSLGGIA